MFQALICALFCVTWAFGFHLASHSQNGPRKCLDSSLRAKDKDSGELSKPKSTKFDRVLDDFVGKRYGAGEAWYGKKKSGFTDSEFEELRKLKNPEEENGIEFNDNAILLVGGLGDINQWIAFDLLEKGFNVRIATTDIKQAIEIFGQNGNNVDIVEIPAYATAEEYLSAINGVQAMVIAASFDSRPFGGETIEDTKVASKILQVRERVCVRERERVCVCVCVCDPTTAQPNPHTNHDTNNLFHSVTLTLHTLQVMEQALKESRNDCGIKKIVLVSHAGGSASKNGQAMGGFNPLEVRE